MNEQALIEYYGEIARPHLEKIIERFAAVVAATIYYGNEGDSNMEELNKIFECMDI